MSFAGSLNVNNFNYKQVESLITVERVEKEFLFGVTPLGVDDEGNKLGPDAIQTYINTAISIIEHDLDLFVMPRQIEEHKDYFANDYWDWGFMQLNRIPVIDLKPIDGVTVSGLRIVYLRDENDLETVLDIPKNWIRLDKATGIIRMVPNNKFPARLQVDASGAFFPELFRRYSTVPNLWVVTYMAGFAEGCIPVALNSAIGLLASIYYMNMIADLNLGAGIAATSLSLDGLSQSITSTASAENTTLSARIKEYNRLLFGDKVLGTKGIIPILRDYYKGQNLSII